MESSRQRLPSEPPPGTARAFPRPSRRLFILAILAAAVLFCNLASPLGPHQNDEDFYRGVAQDMLTRGDWVVPTYLGAPAFQKPPLLYWMTLPAMRVLGPTVLAIRLPVAVLGWFTVLLTAALGWRLWSERAGWLAGAVVATSVGFFQYGRAGMMDVPLVLAVLAAAWGALDASEGRARGPWIAGVATGLGALLKGPVAAALVLAGAAPFLASGGRWRRIPGRHLAGGILAALAVIGVWPLLLAAHGAAGAWYGAFIVGENLGKFAGPGTSVLAMLKGFGALLLPWTILLAAALAVALRRRAWRDPGVALALSFTVGIGAVYSIPAVKWAQYLLPALPMGALLVGWAGTLADARPMRLAGVLTGLLALAPVPLLWAGPRLFPASAVWFLATAMALVIAAWCFAGMPLVRRDSADAAPLEVAAGAMAAVLVGAALLMPAVTLARIPSELPADVARRGVVTYDVPPYQLADLLGRPVGSVNTPDGFRRAFAEGDMIVIGESEIAELRRLKALDERRTEMVLCWRKWGHTLTWPKLRLALQQGSVVPLTENVCLLTRKQQSPSSR